MELTASPPTHKATTREHIAPSVFLRRIRGSFEMEQSGAALAASHGHAPIGARVSVVDLCDCSRSVWLRDLPPIAVVFNALA